MYRAPIVRATIEGPWGPLHVGASNRGVIAAGWALTSDAFDATLRRRTGAHVMERGRVAVRGGLGSRPERHLETALAAIEALLAGRPGPAVDIDLDDRPAWDRRVLHAVAAIPWGTTVSYGEIARRVGSAGAARAVGGAVGRNPISLLVPCHRVIGADGTLGGYGGGAWGDHGANLEIKRDLLLREGVTARRRGATG